MWPLKMARQARALSEEAIDLEDRELLCMWEAVNNEGCMKTCRPLSAASCYANANAETSAYRHFFWRKIAAS